jgi:hypothetical protein
MCGIAISHAPTRAFLLRRAFNYDARVLNHSFYGYVSIGGVASLTLTFFSPLLWFAVAAFAGVALLLIVLVALEERQIEPPAFYVVLAWTGTAVLLALFYGATQEFYNLRQVAFLLCGLVFGYLMSLSRVPPLAAWIPFGLFAIFFSGLVLLGRDPANVFPRNSENYVSVILLALYASAIILHRPARIRPMHALLALLVLALSIWGGGRAGVLASLMLAGSLFVGLILSGRKGVIRTSIAIVILVIAAGAVAFAAELLIRQGYLETFATRGIRDAPRLLIILSYFDGISVPELLFGRNYYHDSFMAGWGYNLHNSYLSAWAHLGLSYLLLLLLGLATTARKLRAEPALCLAVLAFGLRALTDTHLFSGQYDYIVFAVLFLLLRRPVRPPVRSPRAPSRS